MEEDLLHLFFVLITSFYFSLFCVFISFLPDNLFLLLIFFYFFFYWGLCIFSLEMLPCGPIFSLGIMTMLHPQCLFMQYERSFFISKVKNYAASKFAFLCIPRVQSGNFSGILYKSPVIFSHA